MIIIGLCSSTGQTSGKSYCAKQIDSYFFNQTNKKVKHLHFATPVKLIGDGLMQLLGVDPTKKDEKVNLLRGLRNVEISPRDIYVRVGEAMRSQFPNAWVDILMNSLDDESAEVIIIDDVRKAAEIERIREHFQYERSGQAFILNVIDVENPIPRQDSTDIIYNATTFDGHILNYKSQPDLTYDQIKGFLKAKGL
jgi:hypothetical protein